MRQPKRSTTDSLPLPARWWQRFWFEYDPPAAQLVGFRVVLFALLGLDAWMQLRHAPRYGVNDFNVSHIPALDWLWGVPQRGGMLIVFLLQAYLAFRVALGAGGKWAVRLLAVLYGYGYFVSQVDSYQHHYLVFLLLVAASAVDWEHLGSASDAGGANRSGGGERNGDRDRTPPGDRWAIRLILVQVSVLYLWAAIAKLDPRWLDGSALQLQIHDGWGKDKILWLFGTGGGPLDGYAGAAWAVLVTEVWLAIAIHVRVLRWAAVITGVAFHATVELSGFRIGLFSYFMIALYLLVLPPSAFRVLGAAVAPLVTRGRQLRQRWRERADRLPRLAGGLALAGAVAVGIAVLWIIPLSQAVAVGVVAGAVALGLAWSPRATSRANAHLIGHAAMHVIACIALLVCHWRTDEVRDHYRLWGGSLRRLGQAEDAIAAYQKVVDIDDAYADAHARLGDLYLQVDSSRVDDAMREYRAAVDRDPNSARGFAGIAALQHRAGHGAEALAAARRALELDPRNRVARQIHDHWTAQLNQR